MLLACFGLALGASLGACEKPSRDEDGASPELKIPAPESGDPAADVLVDLRDPSSGTMTIEMAFSGLSPRRFRAMGTSKEFSYEDVEFWDGDGQPIDHEHEGVKYELERKPQDAVRVRYRVRPGGEGRHGNQGAVTGDFALFDGRVYLLPADANALRRVRIRFETPEGWSVASPFRTEDGWWMVDPFGATMAADQLASACLGVGPFEVKTRQFGDMEARVFTYGPWERAHKDELSEKSLRIVGWFHESLGFDLGAPYAVVWSPKSTDLRLFGGSHVNGTCFEHPEASLRNWQLLSHRIGHSMNKYPPAGIKIRDPEDHWFKEGWASYVEVIATARTGVASDERYWNTLYQRYHDMRSRHPEYDLALANEPSAKGDAIEYLHYTKGPLVVKMLDHWLRKRSGKNMEQFMAEMWAEYGMYQAEFPLREELEAFAGVSLNEFWATTVDEPSFVIPVWEEAITAAAETRAEQSPAATVADRPVSGPYLRTLAESRDFARFDDIRGFLVRATKQRQALRDHDVDLLPASVRLHRSGLSGRAQYDIDRYYLAWRLDLWPGLAAPTRERHDDAENNATTDGSGAEDNHEPQPDFTFAVATDQRDGAVFGQLLELERAYERQMPASGLMGVYVRLDDQDGPDLLRIPRNRDLSVVTKWMWAPAKVEVTLTGDGDPSVHDASVEPGWTRMWVALEDDELPQGRILRVQISGSNLEVTRPFWLVD